MIWESEPWKDELGRVSARIDKWTKRTRFNDRTGFLIEREIFFGFYAVRKLLDAHKLSAKIIGRPIEATEYPRVGARPPNFNNWDDIDRFFDLRDEAAKEVEIGLRPLCNEVVHSYVFVPLFDTPSRLAGIFLSSDRARNVRLLSVRARDIVETFRAIAQDDLAEMQLVWDSRLQDYQVIVGRSMEEVPGDDGGL